MRFSQITSSEADFASISGDISVQILCIVSFSFCPVMAPLVRLLPPREIDTHLKHLISNLVVNHWLSINFRSTQEASGATLCVGGLCALGGCGQTETTLIQTAVNKQTEQ